MTSRRDFLHVTALATLPLAARAWPGGAEAPRSGTPRLALLEPDSIEALQFGARLAARGAVLHEVPRHDPAPLLFGGIQPLLRSGPASLAGLTSLSTLFCFEQFAWMHGMRVVFHAEHVIRSDGTAAHQVLRGAPLASSKRAWPVYIADVLAAVPRAANATRPGPSQAGLEPPLPRGARLLASWLIA